MVIDLTGQSEIKHDWSYDSGTDTITVTFTDPTGVTVYGSLKIEGSKMRSLMQSMSEVSNFFFPVAQDLTTRVFHKTSFNVETGIADMEFL